MKKWLPWIIVAVFAAYSFGSLRRAPEKDFAWEDFGRIPVMANGRFQPLDSLARNSLLQLREKATALASADPTVREKKRSIPAAQWIAEVMFHPELAESRPNFRIDNLELKQTLGLPVEPDETKKADGKHYSYEQIKPQLAALQEQARQASAVKSELQTPYQSAVLTLLKQVQLFWRLENLVQPRITDMIAAMQAAPPENAGEFLKMAAELKPQDATDWKAELAAFLDRTQAGRDALVAQRAGRPHDEKALADFKRDVVRFQAMSMKGQALIIPTSDPANAPDSWHSMSDTLMEAAGGATPHPAVHSFAEMAAAFRAGRSADFNRTVADYRGQMRSQFADVLAKADREHFFNKLSPFTQAMAIYVAVGLCGIFFWFAPVGGEWLRRSAVLLCVLALIIHAGGLAFRMFLEGRPPVTNLYSAAVFIGFASCVLGLVLETVWRNSIGVIVAAIIGFSTLLVAHHLALAGDTMEMMRAVLDTNFWLATHVVIITLGYASTYVAGFLAIIFVLRGVLSASLDAPLRQSLAKMIYAITCFATLFSFVGTVLGGIWADQSWGRFWGWDPKENGALIIVLWNALMLHARWGGLVRERGLANLAIFGNIVTTWSFFGTNMLGVGLHSYGFMDEQRVAFLSFIASQVVLILVGLLPTSIWRSYRTHAAASVAEREPAVVG
jgi:ABC-type transport system involved in cytochrome c biogenesis permease subunit